MPNKLHVPRCPFYKDEQKKTITCEDTYRSFDDLNHKWGWMKMYCDSWDWMRCPYAMSLNEAYEALEKGDDMALEKNEKEAMKKEMKSLSIKLGKAEKRIERMQKKIDSLRMVNQSFTRVNEDLYSKWRGVNNLMEAYEENVAGQVQVLADSYEARLAFLIDRYGPFSDVDVDEWRKSRPAFALIYDENDDGFPCWQVVFEDEKEGEVDEPGADIQTDV